MEASIFPRLSQSSQSSKSLTRQAFWCCAYIKQPRRGSTRQHLAGAAGRLRPCERSGHKASPLTHQGLYEHSLTQYDRRCLNNTACLFSVLKPHFRLKISKFMELLWSFPLPRLAKWKPNWNFILAQNKSFAHAKRELFAKRLRLAWYRQIKPIVDKKTNVNHYVVDFCAV